MKATNTQSHTDSTTAIVSMPALTPDQSLALHELIAGKGVTAAALAAGVHRGTLHRWMHDDPAFAANYNAWQNEIRDSARARLLALTDSAVSAVTSAVDKGDSRTALTILKSLGILTPPIPGPTDPTQIQREREIDRKQAESKLHKAELEAALGW